MHDVSFAAHPEWYRWREGLRRRWLARLAARQARAVITISEFSRGEIVRHLGISADRVHVDSPWRRASPARRRRPRRANRWCSSSGRSSIAATCQRWSTASRASRRGMPDVRLEIVGANRTHPHVDLRALADAAAPGRIRIRDWVDDDELRSLYERAVGVCVPVGVRRLRPDAARSARRRHSAGGARYRRWHARSWETPRSTSTGRDGRAGRRRAWRRDWSGRRASAVLRAASRRCSRDTTGAAPRPRRWPCSRRRPGHDPPRHRHRVVQRARGPGRHAREPDDAPPATSHEIVVVDNASTDGAPALVRDVSPWCA